LNKRALKKGFVGIGVKYIFSIMQKRAQQAAIKQSRATKSQIAALKSLTASI
jgi:hypothetical protein